MTREMEIRVCNMLTRCKTKNSKHFPKAYVVGEHIFVFYAPAKRQLQEDNEVYGLNSKIEVVSYKHSCEVLGREYSKYDEDQEVDMSGRMFDGGNLYNPDTML